jgi:hypothetical protein
VISLMTEVDDDDDDDDDDDVSQCVVQSPNQ